MPAKTTNPRATGRAKAAVPRMSLAETMAALEAAGSAQTRKTYLRHGAAEPMFGVSFATLKALYKRIGVDHDLALSLWETGNFDAQNLAVKIVDPGRMTADQLDRWAQAPHARMCVGYVAHVTVEGPHARAKADRWLAARSEAQRVVAWSLVGAMAMRDETTSDAWFAKRLAEIERSIRTAPNAERAAMNQAVIAIGCRSEALRRAAVAAAGRIGRVEVDHGDTSCKTPEAAGSIAKAWAHAGAKGFASPAAQERKRESMRTRC
jgi:3-methyladenine DNA glycosylase AlkD